MRISSFRQTVFVNHDHMNRIVFKVADWDFCNPYRMTVFLNDIEIIHEELVYHPGGEFWLPCVNEDADATVVLHPFEDAPVYARFTIHPVRPWSVDFIASSHEDLGYCAYVNKLEAECADFLDIAIDHINRGEGYRYVIEHDWWLRGYEKYRPGKLSEPLKRCFDNGTVELNAPHSGNHTHWQGQELLYRSLYFSCLDARKRWGVEPKTAMYADVSGMTWSALSAYYDMGIRYAVIFRNNFRNNWDKGPMPNIFRWVAPNGRDSLICLREDGYRHYDLHLCDRMRQYPDGTFDMGETKCAATADAIDSILSEMEDTPLDRLPIGYYDDREPPTDMLPIVCREMNRRWENPTFSVDLPAHSLSDIERRFGNELLRFAGDITDQWSDFAAIAPSWFSTRREAERLLFEAETLLTLRCAATGEPYPAGEIDDAVWKLCEFDDHCWATSSKNPQEMHLANMHLVKRNNAYTVMAAAKELIRQVIGEPEADRAAVYNPLPRTVCGPLRLPADRVPRELTSQRMEDGSILTEAVSFGALERKILSFNGTARESAEITDSVFETPYYRVRVNRGAQIIESIFEKACGEELIDASRLFALGDYIYATTEGKTDPNLHFDRPHPRGIRVLKGPLATEIIITGFEEQSGANVEQRYVFYEQDARIDMKLSFRNATGLMGDYYDRYKKNIFFAFPFRMPGGHFLTELAGGVMDEGTERLRVNTHDFVTVHNCAAVENDSRGIALFSRDMPIFHLGNIRFNQFSGEADKTGSTAIYLYAASNRCNRLSYFTPEDCSAAYELSILPYRGKGRAFIPEWSDARAALPLIGSASSAPVPAITLDGSGLRLLACKHPWEGDGEVVVRVAETCGGKTRACVSFPFDVARAQVCDGREIPSGQQADVEGNRVYFTLDPYCAATLRIRPAGEVNIPIREKQRFDVKLLFSFVSENSSTVLCIEKEYLGGAIEVYADDSLIQTAPCDGHYTQFIHLPKIVSGNLRVSRVNA